MKWWPVAAVGGGEWWHEEEEEEEQADSSVESDVEKRIMESSSVMGCLKHLAIFSLELELLIGKFLQLGF